MNISSNYPETGFCLQCGSSSTMCACEYNEPEELDEYYNEDFTNYEENNND